MKKIFTKKTIINKLIITVIFVILFNFAIPVKSNASILSTLGGKLGEYLMQFVVYLSDNVLSLAEYCFTGRWRFVIKGEGLKKIRR